MAPLVAAVVWSVCDAARAEAAPAKVAWSKCHADLGPFECGTVRVPLDHDQPNGTKISIALVRLPATDPARRIGSLFLNPGGPGGSGVDFTLFAGPSLFTEDVRARFDLIEGTPAVACVDTDNPDSYATWSTAAAAADASGYFGRLWTWGVSSLCAEWPHADEDRHTGPFNRATTNPVLVVGTRFDPATRYEGALTVAGLLPNSTLLTVDGWGHTSLFLSGCADDAVARYLTGPELFDDDAVCERDHIPFTTQ